MSSWTAQLLSKRSLSGLRSFSLLYSAFAILIAVILGWLTANYSSQIALISLAPVVVLMATLIVTEKPASNLLVILIVAFFVPLEWAATSAVSINGVVFVLPVIVAILLARILRSGEPLVLHRATMIPMVLFLLSALISWQYGNAIWQSAFPRPSNLFFVQLGQWGIFALSLLAFLLAAQQSLRAIKWLVWGFLGVGIAVIVGRYGGVLGAPFRLIISDTAQSSGTFYVWFTALAFGQSLFNEKLSRHLRVALFISALSLPILGFLFNTQWTTSWLPPILIIFVLISMRSRFLSFSTVVAILISVLAFSGIFFQIFDWEFERRYSLGGRFVLWEAVLRLAVSQPILGLGLTTYRQYYQFIPLLTPFGSWYQPNVNSHNVFIDLFAQTGIVGLVLFIWILIAVGYLGWSLHKQNRGGFQGAYAASAVAGLVGIVFASGIVEWLLPFVYNVGYRGFRFSIFNWLFLGGLIVLKQIQKQDSN